MNSEYIQHLRYKLQKRVRKLESTDVLFMFHYGLKRFFNFLEKNPVFSSLLSSINPQELNCEENAKKIVAKKESLAFDNELEQALTSYFVLKQYAESNNDRDLPTIMLSYGFSKNTIDYFRDYFLEPFYEYLDEQLDEQTLVLNFLLRYKKKVEWFNKSLLFKKIEEARKDKENRIEEKVLSPHLYEYLFDQGIEFQVEPKTSTGRPDLVIDEMRKELAADSKIYDPKNKSYISKGVSQVYTYLQDTGKQFGYFIVFNPSEKMLEFSIDEQTNPLPHLQIGNKTIFLMTVDINPNRKTASKRSMKDIDVLTEKELLSSQ
jgi:hypothetical protein